MATPELPQVGDDLWLTQELDDKAHEARLAAGLWANNTGGDAGDSVMDVRAFRTGDRALSDARYGAQVQREPDPRSEEQIADDLMSALGLDS